MTYYHIYCQGVKMGQSVKAADAVLLAEGASMLLPTAVITVRECAEGFLTFREAKIIATFRHGVRE